MVQRLRLNRSQLAQFLPDPEAVKQFEKLFAVVDEVQSVPMDDTVLTATDAVAIANLNSALMYRIIGAVSQLASAPQIDEGNVVHRYGKEKIPGDKEFTGLVNVDEVRFVTGVTPANTLGTTYWDDAEHTLSTILDVANAVTLNHGEELLIRCVNKTGVTITDGQVVYLNGAQGNRPKIALAKADALATCRVVGVATQDILNNEEGWVTAVGEVHGYDTSVFTEGDPLYLSATVAGAITNVVPASPSYGVHLGFASNSTNNGAVSIHPHSPIALDVALAADSDEVAPSQKAVKSYISGTGSNLVHRTGVESIAGAKTFTENVTAPSFTGALIGNADTATLATDYTYHSSNVCAGDGVTTRFLADGTTIYKINWEGNIALSSSARTNHLHNSEPFDVPWNFANVSSPGPYGASPKPGVTAAFMAETAGVASHYCYAGNTVVAAGAYVFSMWLKANGRTRVVLAVGVGSGPGWGFDLSDGTTFDPANAFTDPDSYGIEAYPNGWYRCWFALSSTTGGNLMVGMFSTGTTYSYSGDITKGIYLWGAQIEAGSVPTAYIKTTNASAPVTVTDYALSFGIATLSPAPELNDVLQGLTRISGVSVTAPITGTGLLASPIAIPAATAAVNGYATSTQITKLDGIAAGAQVNVLEGVTGTAPIVAGAITAKSQAISIPAATDLVDGYLSASAQNIGGVKSFKDTTIATSAGAGAQIWSGGVYAVVTNTGTDAVSKSVLWAGVNANAASASASNLYGLRGDTTVNAACAQPYTGIIAGVSASVVHAGSGAATNARGGNFLATGSGSGGGSSLSGFGSSVSVTGTGSWTTVRGALSSITVNNASSTVATVNAFDITWALTLGTVTTLRGVNVSAISAATLASTTTIVGANIGAINGASTTPATNAYAVLTGNVTGAATNWQLNLGTGISSFADTTDATSSTSAASVKTAGGLAVAKALWVGGLVNVAGVATFANTTDASAIGTAGTVVVGGLSVAKKIYVGSVVNHAAIAASTTNGDQFLETTQNHMGDYVGGMKGWYDRTVCSNYANRTQAGIVTAVSIVPTSLVGSATVPANWFKAGKRLRFIIRGVYTTDASSGNATVQIKIGSTVFRTTGSFALDNSVTNGYWRMEGAITCQTTGATGTCIGILCWEHEATAGGASPMHVQMGNSIAAVTFDTTASNLFDVLWTADDAGTSITCTDFLLIERA